MGGMTGSLLLLLWAGVSVSTMVDLQKRIYNGQNCKDYERLYHVKLNIQTPDGPDFCGGSLINDQWILTARHCWFSGVGETITAELRVHPRGHEINEAIAEENIHKHPTTDLMLLRLTTPQPRFHRIDLPDCVHHPLPMNVMVQIAGHAARTAHSDKTKIIAEERHLQCADIKAIKCPQSYPEPYEELFCGETTDINNPVGGCVRDSGGGVVYDGKIYGVISGGDTKKVCTRPDEFIGVCGHMDWIKKTIEPPKRPDKRKSCFGCG